MALSRDHESLRFPRGYAAVAMCRASYTSDKKAAGGVSGRDERQLSDAERIAKIKSIFGMK